MPTQKRGKYGRNHFRKASRKRGRKASRKRLRKSRKRGGAAAVARWVLAKKARKTQKVDLQKNQPTISSPILNLQDTRTIKQIHQKMYDEGISAPRYILGRNSQEKKSPQAYPYQIPQGLEDFIGREEYIHII
jgi:hypothetical protein